MPWILFLLVAVVGAYPPALSRKTASSTRTSDDLPPPPPPPPPFDSDEEISEQQPQPPDNSAEPQVWPIVPQGETGETTRAPTTAASVDWRPPPPTQKTPTHRPPGATLPPLQSQPTRGTYVYDYNGPVDNKHEEGYLKEQGGPVVVKKGFYTYTDSDGSLVRVNYIADELGYRITSTQIIG